MQTVNTYITLCTDACTVLQTKLSHAVFKDILITTLKWTRATEKPATRRNNVTHDATRQTCDHPGRHSQAALICQLNHYAQQAVTSDRFTAAHNFVYNV